jgi:uncharacterized protein (TIGR00730 family)
MTQTKSGHKPTPSVSLSDEKQVVEVIGKSILGLWEVVNDLTRLRPTRRDDFRVTIFGSARISPEHWVYGAVRDLASELARMGCTIVTGGGPGLMRAANEGAASAGAAAAGRSVGIRVDLPFEQEINPFVGEVFEHRTFFSRLHHFVLVSDAFVVVPGGIGTVLELVMIWQLLQVRGLRETPLILIGPMWAELVEWARAHLLRPEFMLANPADLEIPRCVDTVEEAITVLRRHHDRWRAEHES